MHRILYVVNAPEFFLSHRLPIAQAAREEGMEVHVATGPGSAIGKIRDEGFSHHLIPLSRSGLHPIKELYSLWRLYRVIGKVRPDILHLVTIKPVLYGGVAARIVGVQGVVAAISGLGTVFVDESRQARALRSVVRVLYRLALRSPNVRVIFQNPDDRSRLLGIGVISPYQTVLIRGSGVSLNEYPALPEPEGTPVVVMVSRLLRDKGVYEFVEAARILKTKGLDIRFQLVGAPDPGNPTTISREEIARWEEEGIVEVLGYRSDIPGIFSKSNLVVLPSYREGLPKVLIEAAACARAVVTTDRPGCRDAIIPDETGLLVPAKDPLALANAIEKLILDPVRRRYMGQAGRKLAERDYAIEYIVQHHIEIYRKLLDV